MRPIEGIHHITAITGDAPPTSTSTSACSACGWSRRPSTRTTRPSTTSSTPTRRARRAPTSRSSSTRARAPGRAGAGMVATGSSHRVGSEAALDFWAERLAGEGVADEREPGRLRFADPEGLEHELAVVETADPPLIAAPPRGAGGARAAGLRGRARALADPARSEALVRAGAWASPRAAARLRGTRRAPRRAHRLRAERERGVPGRRHRAPHRLGARDARTIEAWRQRVARRRRPPTPVIDRFYFESVYFREPSGILYELATIDGAGFAADEPAETLGERLSLPPNYEQLRERGRAVLTPLPDVRRWRRAGRAWRHSAASVGHASATARAARSGRRRSPASPPLQGSGCRRTATGRPRSARPGPRAPARGPRRSAAR